VAWGGEDAHVQADLGDDGLGGVTADPGDLVQPVHGRQYGSALAGPGSRAGAAVGVDALGGWHGGDQLLDPAGELADLKLKRVDLVQQHPGQLAVMRVEPAGQRSGQRGVLGLHPPPGQPGQRLRVALAGDQRLDHVPRRQRRQPAGHR
jgi:hypothetical protein